MGIAYLENNRRCTQKPSNDSRPSLTRYHASHTWQEHLSVAHLRSSLEDWRIRLATARTHVIPESCNMHMPITKANAPPSLQSKLTVRVNVTLHLTMSTTYGMKLCLRDVALACTRVRRPDLSAVVGQFGQIAEKFFSASLRMDLPCLHVALASCPRWMHARAVADMG